MEWGTYRRYYQRPSAVGISQRVVKQLRSCATFFDENYRRTSHIPKRTPVRGTVTDEITGGTISVRIFEIFGARFNLFSLELPT